jgi:hypothetical protein
LWGCLIGFGSSPLTSLFTPLHIFLNGRQSLIVDMVAKVLFTAIEASQNQYGSDNPSSSLSKLENKRHDELKRLAYSINYGLNRGQSSRGKGKGRGPIVSL